MFAHALHSDNIDASDFSLSLTAHPQLAGEALLVRAAPVLSPVIAPKRGAVLNGVP